MLLLRGFPFTTKPSGALRPRSGGAQGAPLQTRRHPAGGRSGARSLHQSPVPWRLQIASSPWLRGKRRGKKSWRDGKKERTKSVSKWRITVGLNLRQNWKGNQLRGGFLIWRHTQAWEKRHQAKQRRQAREESGNVGNQTVNRIGFGLRHMLQ